MIPYGYCHCHCGCGQKTQIAKQTRAARGWIRGEPKRFVAGHYYAYRRKLAAERLTSGQKRCSKCGSERPITAEFFRPDGRYADGFRSDCRKCQREYDVKRRTETDYFKRYRARHKALNAGRSFDDEPKVCKGCRQTYPATPEFFSRDNAKPDGLRGKCKACRASDDRTWFYANWERELEKRKEYGKRYRKTPNGILAHRAANLRRRKAIRQSGQRISASEIWQMYDSQGGMCAYCEVPLFGTFHVDHMQPVSKGGLE